MEYTVLWIDDDHSIVDAYQTLAEYRDIDLIHKDNWKDGKIYLEENFDDITAIVLDANCKLSHDGVVQGDLFLGVVIAELQQLFGERQNAIPWYILSAGTMDNFGAITKCVTASREYFNDAWGNAVFLKDDIESDEENPLFDLICKVGSEKENNIVLHRHQNAFKYLGKKDYICQEARVLMLDILTKLYNPANTLDMKGCGNKMRQTIEYIFRHANKVGILPNEFFEKKDTPNLQESMCFLCGRPANSTKLKLWDKANNSPFYVFNEGEYYQFSTVLNFTQKYSHTHKDSLTKELCFGMALLLCHLINSYGRFIDTHKDIKVIQGMWTKVEDSSPHSKAPTAHSSEKTKQGSGSKESENKLINHIVEGCIECTDGTYHIGDVKVPAIYKEYFGTTTKFRIEIVLNNNSSKKDKFPYFTPLRNITEIK